MTTHQLTSNARSMPRQTPAGKNPLRRRWEIALACAGRRPHEVAAVWGVHRNTINGVLSGSITSARIHQKIEAFIRKHGVEAA